MSPERHPARLSLGEPGQHVSWRVLVGENDELKAVELVSKVMRLLAQAYDLGRVSRDHRGVVALDHAIEERQALFHRRWQVPEFPGMALGLIGSFRVRQQGVEGQLRGRSPGHRCIPLKQSKRAEGRMLAVTTDHDMVMQGNPKRASGGLQLARHLDIVAGRLRIARRVIVRDDQG